MDINIHGTAELPFRLLLFCLQVVFCRCFVSLHPHFVAPCQSSDAVAIRCTCVCVRTLRRPIVGMLLPFQCENDKCYGKRQGPTHAIWRKQQNTKRNTQHTNKQTEIIILILANYLYSHLTAALPVYINLFMTSAKECEILFIERMQAKADGAQRKQECQDVDRRHASLCTH